MNRMLPNSIVAGHITLSTFLRRRTSLQGQPNITSVTYLIHRDFGLLVNARYDVANIQLMTTSSPKSQNGRLRAQQPLSCYNN